MGNGRRVRIGIDPWPGSNFSHLLLPQPLVEVLERQNYLFLYQVDYEESTTIFQHGWKSGQQLLLDKDLSKAWGVYIAALRKAHIRLGDCEDLLIWDKSPNGVYSPKVGYIAISVELFNREIKWWWRGFWKLNCSAKNKIFGWPLLENKVPTLDILQKRLFEGPGWCSLCRENLESWAHLFMDCSFSKAVWNESLALLNLQVGWVGDSLEEAFSTWWRSEAIKAFRVIPLIIS